MRRGVSIGILLAAAYLGAFWTPATHFFAKDACERVERFLNQEVVGQSLATNQLIDAVCDHLAQKEPIKPLILSVHGPPGVGKTLSHRSLALALSGVGNDNASGEELRKKSLCSYLEGFQSLSKLKDGVFKLLGKRTGSGCPGEACRSYKVLYGMDYTSTTESTQRQAFCSLLLAHISKFSESLIVVEEYDKVDCQIRGFLRQVFEHPFTANVSLAKFIILLESNLGMLELEALFNQRGTTGVTPEGAHKRLKDAVFEHWLASGCETLVNTLKMVNLVDYFLPYFPLRREDLRAMFRKALDKRLRAVRGVKFYSGEDVVEFLIDKVEFQNKHSLEGGRTVDIQINRYLGRVLRELQAGGRLVGGTSLGNHARWFDYR